KTPLLHASEGGHPIVTKILLDDQRVEPDAKDSWGETSMMLAAWNGHEAIAQLLLNTGKIADLNSPLRCAAEKGHAAVAQLLLNSEQINLNTQDYKGKTPLILAAEKGHKAVVQLLLNTGKVDVTAVDRDGKTALMYAKEIGHRDIIEML
ncbi:hypothetical protein M441DRAFT_117683, partial [Trichoderma asperellum CBS 433.97]